MLVYISKKKSTAGEESSRDCGNRWLLDDGQRVVLYYVGF